MNLQIGPKIKSLSTSESVSSLESWKANITYALQLNPTFSEYIQEDYIFGKKNKHFPFRRLQDVYIKETTKNEKGEDVEVLVKSKGKEQRCTDVDTLLQQIANYCPHVPREDIVKDCATLKDVWKVIRSFYNKQLRGSSLNDIWNVRREAEETPQALYARIKQLYLDNLLKPDSLKHLDGQVEEDEEMTPTLLNTIILQWLQILHPGLRDLVTARFIIQLRDHTYATILPEIFQCVESLMNELNNTTAVNRIGSSFQNRSSYPPARFSQPNRQYKPAYSQSSFNPSSAFSRNKTSPRSNTSKCCQFCKLTGKKMFHTHRIEDCLFIRRMNEDQTMNVKQVSPEEDEWELQYLEYLEVTGEEMPSYGVEHVLNHVQSDASPVIEFQVKNHTCLVTLDTGAPCNLVREEKAAQLGAIIKPTTQRVKQADGVTFLDVVGETDITLYHKNKPYHLPAIVCSDTDTEILAGMPFMKTNDVAVRPYTDEIILGGTEHIKYNPNGSYSKSLKRLTIHSEKQTVLLPGQHMQVKTPGFSGEVAVEPRWDLSYNKQSSESSFWPHPEIAVVKEGVIDIENSTSEPILIHKSEPICNLLMQDILNSSNKQTWPIYDVNMSTYPTVSSLKPSTRSTVYSSSVILNPEGVLSKDEESSFREILATFDNVFSPVTSTYNGHSGPCHVKVNVGSNPPPQTKGRVPFYSDTGLQELQDYFDDLERRGILSRPEEVGVTVENIHPSFLVRSATKKRLVTDFKSIANYCRPSPSLLPSCETTIRRFSAWKIVIKSDMSSAYYQLKMMLESKRYCGVHTPFKGIRVYNVGVMGLPGVESALEELTCLVLGDLVKEGRVCKLADDLFIGGNTVQEAMDTFKLVLHKLQENNIKLNPAKTVIAPKTVTVLGWTWTAGRLKASSHKLSALVSCPPPATVAGLKSFIGAFRFISRVVKGYASLLSPLEDAVQGKEKKDSVTWTDQLTTAFTKAKEALTKSQTITVPRPSDRLSIVTDASVRPGAIGATLYVIRDGTPELAGFFNCKLPEYQRRWLPCELEALAISTAMHHFAPFIIQSSERPQVLTDSKPCVDAANKLSRGEFSASARLSTFISAATRYNPIISHIPGSSNIISDHSSRHPLICTSKDTCAVCKFVAEEMESVVRNITVEDVLSGKARMPWTNRSAWREVQMECSNLRKVKFFKKRGTQPSKKSKNMKQVRKYLSAGTIIAHDDLLINPSSPPLGPVNERIVVPEQVVHGLLTMLHLRSHPSANNLKMAFSRYFYALHIDKLSKEVTQACSQCAALREIPHALIPESSQPPPNTIGESFAGDVMKRWSQKIFCIREAVTSYTLADLIPSETIASISDVIIKQCNLLRPSNTSPITIRLDPHPSHQSLFHSLKSQSSLAQNNINIELGRTLNKNKNPIIDKGIKELIREMLILKPEGGPISPVGLSQAVANLNSRYRRSGMSAQEMWTQRDQVTGEQLPMSDRKLIIQQNQARLRSHHISEKCKARGRPSRPPANISVGDLVYVYSDGSKTQARQRYLVVALKEDAAVLRRFSINQIGGKDIEAKLQEVYRVPYIEDINLNSEEESSDEEGTSMVPNPTTNNHKPLNTDEILEQDDLSSEVDAETSHSHNEISSEDSDTSEAENDNDVSYRPNVPVSPAVMNRPRRTRQPPVRYRVNSA